MRTGGPKTAAGKAKAKANLKPIKPGERRGKGRPAAGLSVKEWLNVMQGWTVAKLETVMKDPGSSLAKKAAARIWKDAACEDRNAAGSPIAGADIDRIFDRTDGKPTQAVVMTGRDGGAIETKHTTEVIHTIDYDRLRRDLDAINLRTTGDGVQADGGTKSVHTDHADTATGDIPSEPSQP